MKKIAILMATYNGGRWITQQINSILSQTYPFWVLYIRDDGSSDDTLSIISKYAAQYSQIKLVVDEKGRSGCPGMNFLRLLCCVDIGAYDYFSFCDQDDVWAPNKIERAIEGLERSNCHGYSCNLIAFDEKKRNAWYLNKGYPQTNCDYLFQGGSAGCTYVITATAASLIAELTRRNFDKMPLQFSHDWLIYAVCRSHRLGWMHDDCASVFYRQHAVNSFGALPGWTGLMERLGLASSGWYRKQVIFLGLFVLGSEDESEILFRVKRCSIADRLVLSAMAGKFRRRRRDALFLSVLILLNLF